jgi:hypothetical protein
VIVIFVTFLSCEPHHVNFAETETHSTANVSRFIAVARSCGSIVNISIEGWDDV